MFFVYLYVVRISQAIFAIYILFLAVYPCSDSDMHEDDKSSEEFLIDQSQNLDTGPQEEICTPFCICACCAAHIRLASMTQLDFLGVVHSTKPSVLYVEGKIFFGNDTIWQPPRI